jgi:hypothetical protein
MRRLILLAALTAILSPLVFAAKAEAHRHPVLWHWYRTSGARCVNSYEGSWSDPGYPYYGGFQMSWWFMQTYAPRRLAVSGTANHWRPFRQVIVVRRVVRDHGWWQWPNTARYCGLL